MLYPIVIMALAAATGAQDFAEGSTIIIEGSSTITSAIAAGTPSYYQYSSTRTVSTESDSLTLIGTLPANSTSTSSSSVAFPTLIVGTYAASETNTGTQTSTAQQPENTQPCNGYVEFCNRQYSNITMVAAHNSPFAVQNNVASNQDYGIFSQLNDGIRMLQMQTHDSNGELRLCHTSCDLLDAGSLEEYLTNATEWLRNHPFEVLTILVGNQDFLDVQRYTDSIESSGIRSYLYEPPQIPMALDDWPTLGQMILSGQRVVFFMDYNADQTAVPYILDEFSQLWETPFSPTNPDFPCDVQRPPNLSDDDARNRMYMANHNLNIDIQVAGLSILVPDTVNIDRTNSDELARNGTLATSAQNCTSQWNRPPNFLLVDYYNRGNYNGSVFSAAAAANGVQYDATDCCGSDWSSWAVLHQPNKRFVLGAVVVAMWLAG